MLRLTRRAHRFWDDESGAVLAESVLLIAPTVGLALVVWFKMAMGMTNGATVENLPA